MHYHVRVQNYKMFGNQQRKLGKNLEGMGKMLIQLSQVGLSIKKEAPIVQSKKMFRWLHC